jgi:hypothetical protein
VDSKKIIGLVIAGFAVVAIVYFLSQKKPAPGGTIPRPLNSPGAGSSGSIPSIIASANALLGRTVNSGGGSAAPGSAAYASSLLSASSDTSGDTSDFANLSATAQTAFLQSNAAGRAAILANSGNYADHPSAFVGPTQAPDLASALASGNLDQFGVSSGPDLAGSVTALDTSAFPTLDANTFLA